MAPSPDPSCDFSVIRFRVLVVISTIMQRPMISGTPISRWFPFQYLPHHLCGLANFISQKPTGVHAMFVPCCTCLCLTKEVLGHILVMQSGVCPDTLSICHGEFCKPYMKHKQHSGHSLVILCSKKWGR